MASRRHSLSIPTLAWGTLGSLRLSRERLPFATALLTYLLSDAAAKTSCSFLTGQWLSQVSEESLSLLVRSGLAVCREATSQIDIDMRADLVMTAEILLFEEKLDVRTIHVRPDGFVPAVHAIGICAGLELLRRSGLAVVNGISINLDSVIAMLTPLGLIARQEVCDEPICEVLDWVCEHSDPLDAVLH